MIQHNLSWLQAALNQYTTISFSPSLTDSTAIRKLPFIFIRTFLTE